MLAVQTREHQCIPCKPIISWRKILPAQLYGENQIISHRKLEQIHHAHLGNLYHSTTQIYMTRISLMQMPLHRQHIDDYQKEEERLGDAGQTREEEEEENLFLLKRVSYYEDAARLFGRIPLQRLGAGMVQDHFHKNFHVMMNQTDLSDWRSRRTIEAVLFFHPNAKILIHVEGYVSGGSQGLFTIFAESGHDVRLIPISSQRASVKQIKMLLQRSLEVFFFPKAHLSEALFRLLWTKATL
eukprot:scaffold6492_cov118-Skeletonema_dohrnii-CCMP3373.AAC.4